MSEQAGGKPSRSAARPATQSDLGSTAEAGDEQDGSEQRIVGISPPFSGTNSAPTPSNTTSSAQYPTTYTTTPINSMRPEAEPSQKVATGYQPQQGQNNPGPILGAGATQFLAGGGLCISGRLPTNTNREDRRICEGHYIRGNVHRHPK
ncbi:hypothetical protein LTR70_001349 [Exophiala xenobiotica]|nr:hypothetical protein LTR70_001349 [Exophiala xenobiotica]